MCQSKLNIKEFEIDHIKPLAAGGDNNYNNLQILCKKCHFVKSKDEKDNNEYVKISQTSSTFNNETRALMESDFNKVFACVQRFEKEDYHEINNQKVYTFDINKCRANCILNNKHAYPQFTCMDEVKPHRVGQKRYPGVYFVESSNTFPLRGNGLYRKHLVDYCLENNLIKEEQIKYYIKSSLTIAHDYFNKLALSMRAAFGDDSKQAINSIIGSFKPKESNEILKCKCIVADKNDAFRHLVEFDGGLVQTLRTDNEKYFYELFDKEIHYQNETESELYKHILEEEIIYVHEVTQLI